MNYLKPVQRIDFAPSSPEEIRNYSACEVTHCDLYEKNGEPKHGGLNDLRMGSTDKNMLCKTCKQNSDKCPGHFGHIELAVPVYNTLFLERVKTILSCVCHTCSFALVDKQNIKLVNTLLKMKKEQRMKHIVNINKKTKVCYNCSRIQAKYSKDGLTLFRAVTVGDEEKKEQFPAYKAVQVLKNIPDDDIVLLGLDPSTARPEWCVFQAFPVVPPCIRPSVSHSTNLKSEDDLVYKMIDIIKANQQLSTRMKNVKSDKYFDQYVDQLQCHVTTLIDNDISGIPQAQHRSGRALKSLKERIKGKEGRIRGNILGKRVNFSARSVVGPDPSLNIDQLGVPFDICKKITFPETANYYNFKKLEGLIVNGPDTYPGANFIVRTVNGKEFRKDLRYVKDTVELRYGDVVHRHLLTDDYVLFNRQPSLHKMSMMGHRVKPIKGKSFRLNPAVCNPYNADFDGDEMNLFCPQNMQSMIEIANIACVPEQIISPQSNSPIIGCIMDVVVGSMKMTLPDQLIDEATVNNIIVKLPQFYGTMPVPDVVDNGRKLWRGRKLMSMLLPDINYFKKDKKDNIEIVNGQLVSGVFGKSIVGSSAGGLVHMITNDINEHATKDFLDNIQHFINSWLKHEGFSVGYGDTLTSIETGNKINDIIGQTKAEVNNYIRMMYEKKVKISQDDFEKQIFNKLNKARDDAGSLVMKSVDIENSLFAMVSSGAKGNSINISQIMGCVGQQNSQWNGKSGRIPLTFANRTLPYYQQHDASPEARGFIESSYLKGLTVTEFFFHGQSGREGIIDTACKTAETGYIQRKLIKSLEDLKVQYDMTVRNEADSVIQFSYGGDNFDPKKVEKQQFELVKGSDADFKNRYQWTKKQLSVFDNSVKVNMKVLEKEFKDLKKLRKEFRDRQFHLDDEVYQPINVFRIVKQSIRALSISADNKSDLQPEYVLQKIAELQKIIRLNCNEEFPYNEINEYNLRLLRTLIQSKLATKVVIFENKLSKAAFDWVVDRITEKFYKALIHPGEAVGPIAAQSLGEPTTQLTLNTFHYSGVSSKSNVNQGVPRIVELISASKKPKTPSLTVYLQDKYNKKDKAKEILNNIENSNLSYFIDSSSIWYDCDVMNSCIEEDAQFVREYYDFYQDVELSQLSPWVLRIKINPLYLVNKDMTMFEIYTALLQKYNKKKIHIIYSDDNAENLVFHLRYLHTDIDEEDSEGFLVTSNDYKYLAAIEEDVASNCVLKGLSSIERVTMREVKQTKIKKDGAIDETKKEIVLDTTGTNLQDILMLGDIINQSRTISNDLHEVYEMLGVEAARELLKSEVLGVLNSSGIYVNARHIELLVDSMTCKGGLISMDRHGINKTDAGTLAKASFEEPHEHFVKGALFNQSDDMKSITSNIIMGQIAKFGTGICQVVFNDEMLEKYAYKNEIQKEQKRKTICLKKKN